MQIITKQICGDTASCCLKCASDFDFTEFFTELEKEKYVNTSFACMLQEAALSLKKPLCEKIDIILLRSFKSGAEYFCLTDGLLDISEIPDNDVFEMQWRSANHGFDSEEFQGNVNAVDADLMNACMAHEAIRTCLISGDVKIGYYAYINPNQMMGDFASVFNKFCGGQGAVAN